MKKNIHITSAFLLICAVSLAQQPSKPNHQKRVYKSEGSTYVQKDLPIYLNFSTSPNGEQHRLTSKATSEYADPMYLDTEGINYIRSHWAVDQETGKTIYPKIEVLYELYADGLAPQTAINFSGAPRYNSGSTVYYGKGLQVSLSARDGVSGVEAINYALNGAAFQKYGSNLNMNKEGQQSLHFYAYDFVGNAEEIDNRSFTVDLTNPSSSHSIVGIVHQNNIIAPSTRFSLSSTDNLSGVRATYYSFSPSGANYYSSPINVNSLSDGMHTLYYYSKDRVDNEESRQSFQFYLDKIPPVPASKIMGDQYKGNYTYVSARTTINFSATDNKAGVKGITYNIDGTGNNSFSSDFGVPNDLGLHYIRYTSTDKVENTSSRNTLTVYVDNRAPSTGINYGSPQFFSRDTLFINKSTDITLRKSDGHSGLQKTEYKIDGGSFKNYSAFTIPQEGNHVISFRSTDNVNNVEDTKTSRVFVDNAPPEIYVNFSIDPIGTKDGLKVYPNYTRLYVGATDDHCGTEEILYAIDDEELHPYSSPYSLDLSEVNRLTKQKKYTVKILSKDKLGNTSEKTVEFYVGQG